MRILTVSNMYPSAAVPSYGTFVRNFFEEIKLRNPGGVNDKVVIRGKRNSVAGKLTAYVGFYSALTWRLLTGRYDIIYIHTVTFPIIPVRLVSMVRRLPIVFNVHGDDVLPVVPLKKWLKRLARPVVPRALMVVSPSNYFKDVVVREFPGLDADKVLVSASGGVNKRFFADGEKPEHGGSPLLGYVSRIEEGKGWRTFVEAVVKLRAEGIDARGVMGGGGPDAGRLRALIAERGLKDVIDYRGPLSQEELPATYRSMDLFIFPTTRKRESLGLVGLEAMAAGVPVIASDMAGPAEYVTDGSDGFLFTPGSVDSLVDAVHRYLSLPADARAAMSRAARAKALTYEATGVADRLYQALTDLQSPFHNFC